MLYILNVKTKWGGREFTALTNDTADLPVFFKDWATKYNVLPKSIWYADVYAVAKHAEEAIPVGSLELMEDGNVLIDIDEEHPREINYCKRWLRRFGIDRR